MSAKILVSSLRKGCPVFGSPHLTPVLGKVRLHPSFPGYNPIPLNSSNADPEKLKAPSPHITFIRNPCNFSLETIKSQRELDPGFRSDPTTVSSDPSVHLCFFVLPTSTFEIRVNRLVGISTKFSQIKIAPTPHINPV